MSRISDVNLSVEQLATYIQKASRHGAAMTADNRDASGTVSPSAAAEGVVQPDSDAFVPREFPLLSMQPKFQPAADDRYHVDELLRFHDREFVRNAYRAVLKRTPEAGGFREYLEHLREGNASKIDVLASMHYSPEGAQRGVHVAGLRLPFLLCRAGRLPIIGYLVRWVVALLRLPVLVHNHAQFSAYTTTQLEHAAEHVNHLAAHSTGEINRFAHHVTQQLIQITERQHRLQADLTAHTAEQRARFAAQDARLDENEMQTTHHSTRFEQYTKRFEDVLAQLEMLWQNVEQFQTQTADATALRDELRNLKQMLQRTLMEFNLQAEHTAHAARETEHDVSTALLSETKAQPSRTSHATTHHFTDAMYAAFEDRFRGTPEEIKERLSVYLPLVRQAPAGDVLDLGSGRGEWLELLRTEGKRARGVDTNRVFVADCRARNLDVVETDAISYLCSLDANSLAMISGLHIVEHLPLDALTELLTEAARVLQPGGLALFETPNPENVLVGSLFFYVDPTHRNPLPSLTLRFLLESRGFDRVEVMNLHPYESAYLPRMNETDHTTVRFNELFYGPMDYGISGWKPQR